MKFQLKKLIIWPNSQEFAPRVVEFEIGKVNVITGSSRTGKSAIIPIIDYCLASSDCNIPIDTIRDNASWYGAVFHTETEDILISRRVPQGNRGSNDYYLQRGETISIPSVIDEPNEKTEGIKEILNSLASVPYFTLNGDESDKPYQARLGFRDLMALVFQTQDLVANQNLIFYKTHAHEHRERLRNWFPYILGAEDIDVLIARQSMQVIEKRLSLLKREFERTNSVSDSWMERMRGHIDIAQEYGLVDADTIEDYSNEELINIARATIENIPNYSQSDFKNIANSNENTLRFEAEDERLSVEIATAKNRMNDIRRLKTGFQDYGNSVRKRKDRLHISQWLKDISTESTVCPACGSADHPDAALEISKISEAFEEYENVSLSVSDIPTSFLREEGRSNDELQRLLIEKNANNQRLSRTIAKDEKAQQEFQRRKSMFLFLGHLEASLETFERLSDSGTLLEEIENLERERNKLLEIIDTTGVGRRLSNILSKISQGIIKHLGTLDVEEKYRLIPPEFSVKDLNIRVQSNDGHWHFLSEVGSASNWVSFHIALICSLHEYFLSQTTSCVPSFVVFDQPSQVYFPKLQRGEKSEDNSKYEDEDVGAVKSIFQTLANSVIESKGSWQAIILDHADEGIYGGIAGIHEVDVWRGGKKLIPTEWYAE